MTLLLTFLIVLVVLALVLYAIDLIPLGDVRIKRLIQAVVVLFAALWVAQRAGGVVVNTRSPKAAGLNPKRKLGSLALKGSQADGQLCQS